MRFTDTNLPRRLLGALLLLVLLLPCLPAASVHAEDDEAPLAPAADRAKILQAELSRRSVDLVPYLQPTADPRLRRLAIRALGRIGDDGNAPGILRDLLATTKQHRKLLLWSAGIAQSEELADPLLDAAKAHVAAKEWELAAQAARSLGWAGGEEAQKALTAWLSHGNDVFLAGVLEGLGRARVGTREALLAASALVDHAEPDVRAAADYACWLCAGRFKAAASKENEAWDGDEEIAKRFLGHLQSDWPERRMGGIRVLGTLLPSVCTADGPFGAIYALVDDEDPRVAQDAIWRILSRRAGHHSTAALAKALIHDDPKVRSMAAEALGKQELPAAIDALAGRWEPETDARVREAITIELVRHGKDEFADRLLKRKDRPKDPVVRQLTEAQLLLVSQRPEALGELMVWADPGASQRAGLHAATWMSVLGGMEDKEHPKLDAWLLGFLAGGYAVDKPDRHHVMASAVSLVGANKRHGLTGTLLEMLDRTYAPLPHDEIRQNVLDPEVRKALMEALAELAGDEACPAVTKDRIVKAVQRHWEKDPSPWVRQAARAAGKTLKLEDVPELDEVGQPNTWRGIPQTVRSDDPDEEPTTRWLDADDIVRMADWIANTPHAIEFITNCGSFWVSLDAVNAPAHAVSMLTAISEGKYTNTRFHRVVPNFVIQGGDPHGHGAGNGGWEIPDEITETPYERGALGMPKSVKDDGGCQIFVMHAGYRPLNERYTCYGKVIHGMDVVDKIRVGDRIKFARITIATGAHK